MAVLIKTSTIEGYNKKIETELKDLDTNISSLKNNIIDISRYWKGLDHKDFDVKMKKFLSDLEKIYDYIDDLNTFIENYTSDINAKVETKYNSTNLKITLK